MDYKQAATAIGIAFLVPLFIILFAAALELEDSPLFVLIAGLGLFTVWIGSRIKVGSISTGLVVGGVLSIILGSLMPSSAMDEGFRASVLFAEIALLIWIGRKMASPGKA